jgi:hypothetical protein
MKESINVSAADFPISDLNIYTKNFRIVYEPKQDITPYELSRLMQLFFVLTTIKLYGSFKVEEFLQEHNLGRHFSYHSINA